MPDFTYTARTETGEVCRGRLAAADRPDALRMLLGRSLCPVEVAPAGDAKVWGKRVPGRHLARDVRPTGRFTAGRYSAAARPVGAAGPEASRDFVAGAGERARPCRRRRIAGRRHAGPSDRLFQTGRQHRAGRAGRGVPRGGPAADRHLYRRTRGPQESPDGGGGVSRVPDGGLYGRAGVPAGLLRPAVHARLRKAAGTGRAAVAHHRVAGSE